MVVDLDAVVSIPLLFSLAVDLAVDLVVQVPQVEALGVDLAVVADSTAVAQEEVGKINCPSKKINQYSIR